MLERFTNCFDFPLDRCRWVITSAHSPVIEGPYIEQAFNRIRELPGLDPPALPDQSVLDQVIAATSQPPS